jgi:lipoprotein-releasing system permease protein
MPEPAAINADGAGPFSSFERMMAFRYLRARRKEAFVSVIAIFSFIGIMLGVGTLIIVMAVLNGFRTELLSRILGVTGHVIVQPIESPLSDFGLIAERLAAVPGVTFAAPMVEGQVLSSGPSGSGSGKQCSPWHAGWF